MKVLAKSLNATFGAVEGYTDEVESLLKNATYGLSALETLVDDLESRVSGNVALASVLGALDDAGAEGAVTEADTLMAYMKQRVKNGIHMMQFAGNSAVVVVTGTGTDLDFPSVTIAGIPSGATLLRVDAILAVGSTFDTSASENQIKTGTTDYIHVKKSTGAWGTDDIQAIQVPALAFETGADAYGSGGVIFGNTDLKSEVDGNATYNFRSEETNASEAIEATGGNLELHTVSIIVRVWFY